MAAQISQPAPKKSPLGLIGTAGGAIIGGVYGGPAGAATGASLGGSIGGAVGQQTQTAQVQNIGTPESSPLMRRQQQIESDPATQMRNGKIALASMDAETRKAFEPVLDEGLRRHAQDRKQQYGYGYTGGEIA
jgi:hypothetical protein